MVFLVLHCLWVIGIGFAFWHWDGVIYIHDRGIRITPDYGFCVHGLRHIWHLHFHRVMVWDSWLIVLQAAAWESYLGRRGWALLFGEYEEH